MAKCGSPSRTSSQRRGLSLLHSRTSGSTTTRSPDNCKMRGCKSSWIPSTRCFSALTTKGCSDTTSSPGDYQKLFTGVKAEYLLSGTLTVKECRLHLERNTRRCDIL